ncbi:MAG: GNAT family N-acetyltransferase [Pseudomonadota bacterium]
MLIRSARREDGAEAIQVLCASITKLCVDDHHNQADRLTPWLANKTVETFQIWLDAPDRILLMAEQDQSILGVGMASIDGEIMLNYVTPNGRLEGVSSKMLAALEQELREQGLTELYLESTQTAHRFYQARGWEDAGAPISDAGMISYPMRKIVGP